MAAMLIDTHAHVNFNSFKDDSKNVVRRSLDNDVWVINVGSQYSTSKGAVEMAKEYERGVYSAIGLHPIHVKEEEFDYEKYKQLASAEGKVVAIGEIGLDYKLEYILSKEKQIAVFRQQLGLAKELNLPVILHCRLAHKDLIEIISNFQFSISNPGAVHCFTGTWEDAQKYMELGFYLGFNGTIFKMDLDEVVARTPLGKILLETDCPYLTPPQERGKRNEPIFIKYIAEKIAKVKNLNYEEVSNQTCRNAKSLFNLN